jgi:hypothetical protein
MRNSPDRRLRLRVALAAPLLLVSAAAALARPKIPEAFFSAYPSAVGTRLDDLPSNTGHCGVCHFDFNGGGPRNPYGQRVEEAINRSPACTGNDAACLTARILEIAGEDSDADGYSQDTEISSTSLRVATRRFGDLGGGAHKLTWDGRDDRGRDAGSGVFWAQVRAGREAPRRKVVRLR